MQSNRDAPIYRIPKATGAGNNVESTVENYLNYHNDSKGNKLEDRKEGYTEMINHYYDLCTDFYEWGWGQSFHFANRFKGENFFSSIARSEHWLALQMGLKPGMTVLDAGCGVGGPAREIARFSGCHVTGVNNNQYQVERARKHTKSAQLEHLVDFVKGNFMELPFPDNHFDAIYQIEATAHAPDKVACYSELLRVLKPGGVFGSYEWCLTKNYDPDNAQHVAIKKGIEEGDGLPDIATTDEVVEALVKSGYRVEAQEDRCKKLSPCDIPWYEPIAPRYNFTNFHHTEIGHKLGATCLRTLEKLRILNKGTAGVQEFLHTAAVNLTLGGEKEIFTPAFFTLAYKKDAKVEEGGKKSRAKRHRKNESVFDLINEIETTGELKSIEEEDYDSGKAELAKAIVNARKASNNKRKRKTNKILYSGWIKKLSTNRHYKKRFFILYSNRMFSYYNQPDGIKKGGGFFYGRVKYTIDGNTIIFLGSDLKGRDKNWELRFESLAEQQFWQRFAEDPYFDEKYGDLFDNTSEDYSSSSYYSSSESESEHSDNELRKERKDNYKKTNSKSLKKKREAKLEKKNKNTKKFSEKNKFEKCR